MLRTRERKLHIKRPRRKRKDEKETDEKKKNKSSLLTLTLYPLPRVKHRPQPQRVLHLLTKAVRKNPVTNQKAKSQKRKQQNKDIHHLIVEWQVDFFQKKRGAQTSVFLLFFFSFIMIYCLTSTLCS